MRDAIVRATSGVCGGKSYPGESWLTTLTATATARASGGKCCQFDMYSYNSSSHYHEWQSYWATGRFDNCTACGGVVWQGEETSNSDSHMRWKVGLPISLGERQVLRVLRDARPHHAGG